MRLRMLVAYSMSSTHVSTTKAYLEALSRYINFDVSYVHVTHDAALNVNPNAYDIVFHNYCGRLCFPNYISESYRAWIKSFKGLKVAAIQDEYDFTNTTKANIKDLGFHIVLTCVPQDQLEYVYPKAEFPDVTFITVLTGYVADDGLADIQSRPLSERPIHVGYRGNILPARYGRLGFEKFDIGRQVKIACEKRGIPHDIAMDAASRIYGRQWFEFIGSCRTILGAESGCNAFDFDGSLDQTLKAHEAAKGRPLGYEEFKEYIGDREEKISMGQISPRVFEAAAMHTPMILFRGNYSGLIEPDTHYIPLEKDYSNLDEVLSRLADLVSLERMASRAYEKLVGSKKYTYSAYGRFLETLLIDKYEGLLANGVISPERSAIWQPSVVGPDEDLEAFLKLQGATDVPRGIGYLNWAYYRGGRAKLEREIDRLWSVYDDLRGQALPWARSNARSYTRQRYFLTPAQRRKVAEAEVPETLSLEPLLRVEEMAAAFRAKCCQNISGLEWVVPGMDEIDNAAAEEERAFENSRALIAELTGYIEELQREFNNYCSLSSRAFSVLNSIMTWTFLIHLPLSVLRRAKRALTENLR